ncbi:MAG: hypothetical protein IJP64_01290 [Oscillospiraceae bacterium]|nr:hypothetical protein [Oscillospiraceae bacterium]
MKKAMLAPLLILCLLLGGCANKNEALFRSFSSELRGRNDLTATAEVRAEDDEKSCRFTLRYTEDGEGGCTVEVLDPALIRGVKARMSADGTKLVYEDVAVDTGSDGGSGLSPMGALPLLMRALRDGALDSAWKESGNLAVSLRPEDGVELTVLFDAGMKPDYAEITHEGKAVLFIEIGESNF